MKPWQQWAAKLLLLIVWPLVAVVLVAFSGVLMVFAWLLIPVSTIVPKEGGGHTLRFPWDDAP